MNQCPRPGFPVRAAGAQRLTARTRVRMRDGETTSLAWGPPEGAYWEEVACPGLSKARLAHAARGTGRPRGSNFLGGLYTHSRRKHRGPHFGNELFALPCVRAAT